MAFSSAGASVFRSYNANISSLPYLNFASNTFDVPELFAVFPVPDGVGVPLAVAPEAPGLVAPPPDEVAELGF